MRNRLLIAGIGLCCVAVGIARCEVQDVPIAKLPAAVVKAVRDRYATAHLEEATREVGTPRYEVTLKADGRVYDVTVTESGAIERIDKEATAAELPKPVKAALDKAYPKAAIKSLLEVTRIAAGRDVDDGYRAYLEVSGERPVLVRIERDGTLTKQ
jgi:hypothetical protein